MIEKSINRSYLKRFSYFFKLIMLKARVMKPANIYNRGFSLIELLVALAMSSVVLAGIYIAYRTQAGSYITQQMVVDMQQDARSAMYYMQRSIRMSGFDPQGTGAMGFVANFSTPYDESGATTDAENIAFIIDDDEEGDIDPSNAELIAYRLDNNRLQWLTAPNNWEDIAENIDALNFVYLDEAGAVIPDPAADLASIRSVQITLVARAGENPSPLSRKTADNTDYMNQQGDVLFSPGGDNFRRIILTAQVKCRNLGL